MTFVSSIYFLIDAERPFTGLVRVDLSIFKNMLDEINNLIVKLDEALETVGFASYESDYTNSQPDLLFYTLQCPILVMT